jgi:hypothetical protein
MCECICYIRATSSRGLILKPTGNWDGTKKSTDPESRRDVTGTVVYLYDVPIVFSSVTQKHVKLSVTEAELAAVVTMVQDMMYVYWAITGMGLQVELPMTAEMDNNGVSNLANSWSIGGRTRHVDVRMFFLHELKEKGMVVYIHIPGPENEADIFTKNVDAGTLHRHSIKLCGLLNLLKGNKP